MRRLAARLCFFALCAAACDSRACDAPPIGARTVSPLAQGMEPALAPPTALPPEPAAPPAAPRPRADASDVLVVTIDTARADHFGAYGSTTAHTPAFDALAAAGVRYERATTPTPLTGPAHTTLFTGRHPAVHGTEINSGPAPLLAGRERPTLLAQSFVAAGYRTAAFVASVILAPRVGLSAGFETYDAPTPAVREVAAQDRVERALAWVDTAHEAPFFLWVHFMEPHAPHVAPPGSAADVEPYDAELTAADAALGALLAGLEARGRGRPLIVVVAGDHGEGLGDHVETEHGVFVYDDTLHVPLVLRASGRFDGGRVVATPVTLADLAPTLRALCGLPSIESDGVSLLALPAARDLFAQSLYPKVAFGWAPLFALQRGSFVYIDAPRPELYDLASDPRERRNVLAAQPTTARTLAAALSARRDELASGRLTGLQPAAHDVERAQLAALGYASATGSVPTVGPDPKVMIRDYEARRAAHRVDGLPPSVLPQQ